MLLEKRKKRRNVALRCHVSCRSGSYLPNTFDSLAGTVNRKQTSLRLMEEICATVKIIMRLSNDGSLGKRWR